MRKDIERFVRSMGSERGYSTSTIRAYRYELDRFVDFVGDWAPSRIREIDVRMYMMRLARSNGPAGQRRALAVLSRFFEWLLAQGRIKGNPMNGVARPLREERRPRYLGAEEIEELVDAVEEVAFPPRKARDLAIVSLMLHAGVRLSELVALNRKDVDLASGTVAVGGGRARRVIPLNADLRNALSRHVAKLSSRDDEPLFVNGRGERLSRDGVYYLVKRYMRAAGILDDKGKASPQTLRHTFCARLLAKGASVPVVKELSGQTSLDSAAIYLEAPTMDKKDAVALLATKE